MPDARTITAAISIAVAGVAVGYAYRTPTSGEAFGGLPARPRIVQRDVMCPTPQNGPFCTPSACAAGELQAMCTDTPDGGLRCTCVTVPDGGHP